MKKLVKIIIGGGIFLLILLVLDDSDNNNKETIVPTSNKLKDLNIKNTTSNTLSEILGGTRGFYMGFTPWPYKATFEAIDDVYDKIQNSGDIVAHHLDGGIPWQELSKGVTYHENVENELSAKIEKTKIGKIIYLGISPLNSPRTGLAMRWGNSTGEELKPPFKHAKFDDKIVIDAYSKFALDLIGRFNPKYFNCGIEINELMINDPEKYNDYIIFIEKVSQNIKAIHPNLILMVSLTLKTPDSDEMLVTKKGYNRIKEFVDLVGISTYGYAFYSHADKGDPDKLPEKWLSQIKDIVGDKPIAITETGWVAENLEISDFNLNIKSSEEKQRKYIEKLFNESEDLNVQFIIWFSVVDFDDLWKNLLGKDDISKIWKDTGLYDEKLKSRGALKKWNNWLAREYVSHKK